MTNLVGMFADRALKGLDRSASTNAGSFDFGPIADDDEQPLPGGGGLAVYTLASPGSVGDKHLVEPREPELTPMVTCFLPVGYKHVWSDPDDLIPLHLGRDAVDNDVFQDIVLCIQSDLSSAQAVWTAADLIQARGSNVTEVRPFEELAGRADSRVQIQSLIDLIRDETTRPDWAAIAGRAQRLVELAEEEDDTELGEDELDELEELELDCPISP